MFLDGEMLFKLSKVKLEFVLSPLFRIPIQQSHSYYDNADERKRKDEKPTLVQGVVPSIMNILVPLKSYGQKTQRYRLFENYLSLQCNSLQPNTLERLNKPEQRF